MLAILIQKYDKKIISFQERETNGNFTGCQVPHFMIVLTPQINLSNLSWIIRCLFLRNTEPLTLKAPRKTASENVVCLCCLLYLLANFSNLFLHTGKQCGPWSDCLIWVHTVCNNDFENHKQMTKQKTIVVTGALRVLLLVAPNDQSLLITESVLSGNS